MALWAFCVCRKYWGHWVLPRTVQDSNRAALLTVTLLQPRPLSSGAFMSMFKTDNSKQSPKADAEKEKDTAAQVRRFPRPPTIKPFISNTSRLRRSSSDWTS